MEARDDMVFVVSPFTNAGIKPSQMPDSPLGSKRVARLVPAVEITHDEDLSASGAQTAKYVPSNLPFLTGWASQFLVEAKMTPLIEKIDVIIRYEGCIV